MASDISSDEPLISNPIIKTNHSASHEEIPISSTIIPMNSHFHRSLSKNDRAIRKEEVRQKAMKLKKAQSDHVLADVSHRLTKRTQLQKQCCFINDIMCLIAFSSILLMIWENELTFALLDYHETKMIWSIKLILTISTIVLILLIIYYHYLDMVLYSVNNSLQYWHAALNRARIIQIIMEIFICAIHPFPRGFPHDNKVKSEINNVNSTISVSGSIPLSFIPIDIALGLPMFARLYLLCRTITFHSSFLRDSSSRSIGYLNKVPINFFFVMKGYLEQSPGFCLGTFCFVIFCIGSWSFRACNYTTTHEHLSILNSMWLFFTLFTTVGYGDIVPTTYCGRGVATLTAFTGVTVGAFLIAVLSQKLLLSRWEKYIYNFALNIQLAKAHKEHAANIIHYAWKMWQLKRMGRYRSIEYMRIESKFFGSISAIRQMKRTRLQLTDNVIGLPEIMNLQRDTNSRSVEVEAKMASNELRMDDLENLLKDIKNTMQTIDNRLNLLLEKST